MKDNLVKIEKTISELLKPLPRIPKKWCKKIAENVWWIQLIFSIIVGIGIISSIDKIFTALSVANKFNAYFGQFYQAPIVYGGLWISTATVSLIFSGICLGIMISSIKPLKDMKIKGWNLLALMFCINLLSSLFSLIANFNIFTLIFGMLGVALYTIVGIYLLFEIKPCFMENIVKKEEKEKIATKTNAKEIKTEGTKKKSKNKKKK